MSQSSSSLPSALDAAPIERSGLPGLLQAAILRLDARLRRGADLIDIGAPDQSFFRVVLIKAEHDLLLTDGSRLAKGDPVIEVHFHNARLPQTNDHGGLGWAARFGRLIVSSFRALALAVESDPRLKETNAVLARLAFAGERSRHDTRRFGTKFGFQTLDTPPPVRFGRKLHDFGEDLWLVGLTWVFNPGSLKGRSTLRRREDLWMSRSALLGRYGPKRED